MERQNNRCKWIIACVAIILLEASYSFAKTVNNYNQMSLKKITKECSQLRTGLLKDRYRLGYHIVAPEGICIPFDCNGAIFWNGRYHLMYLAGEKSMEWWHVSSHDLVHWRHHPRPWDLTKARVHGAVVFLWTKAVLRPLLDDTHTT